MPWAMVCWAFSPFQPYRSKNFQYGLLSLENNKYNLYNKLQRFDKLCAEPSSLEFCHGEKGYHKMEPTRFACRNLAAR